MVNPLCALCALCGKYHLARWGRKAAGSEITRELPAYTGIPEFDYTRIAVFNNTTNDPV